MSYNIKGYSVVSKLMNGVSSAVGSKSIVPVIAHMGIHLEFLAASAIGISAEYIVVKVIDLPCVVVKIPSL